MDSTVLQHTIIDNFSIYATPIPNIVTDTMVFNFLTMFQDCKTLYFVTANNTLIDITSILRPDDSLNIVNVTETLMKIKIKVLDNKTEEYNILIPLINVLIQLEMWSSLEQVCENLDIFKTKNSVSPVGSIVWLNYLTFFRLLIKLNEKKKIRSNMNKPWTIVFLFEKLTEKEKSNNKFKKKHVVNSFAYWLNQLNSRNVRIRTFLNFVKTKYEIDIFSFDDTFSEKQKPKKTLRVFIIKSYKITLEENTLIIFCVKRAGIHFYFGYNFENNSLTFGFNVNDH